MGDMPIIDREKCQGCGLCVDVCACGALKVVDGTVQAVAIEDCGWCALCELVCPSGAITCPFEVVVEEEKD
jgi:NAD-dependent dihydropyrimidine dehydrogenase PreA subunit